jgi:hypothetical protein
MFVERTSFGSDVLRLVSGHLNRSSSIVLPAITAHGRAVECIASDCDKQ